MSSSFVVLVVEIEIGIIVRVEEFGCLEVVDGSSVLLGGPPCSSCAIYESADAVHLEQFILFGWSDVFQDVGQQSCPHPFFDGLFHQECVGHGWLPHTHLVACLDVSRGFGLCSVDGDASVFAGIGGEGARLVDAGGPEPFVYAGFVVGHVTKGGMCIAVR